MIDVVVVGYCTYIPIYWMIEERKDEEAIPKRKIPINNWIKKARKDTADLPIDKPNTVYPRYSFRVLLSLFVSRFLRLEGTCLACFSLNTTAKK